MYIRMLAQFMLTNCIFSVYFWLWKNCIFSYRYSYLHYSQRLNKNCFFIQSHENVLFLNYKMENSQNGKLLYIWNLYTGDVHKDDTYVITPSFSSEIRYLRNLQILQEIHYLCKFFNYYWKFYNYKEQPTSMPTLRSHNSFQTI